MVVRPEVYCLFSAVNIANHHMHANARERQGAEGKGAGLDVHHSDDGASNRRLAELKSSSLKSITLKGITSENTVCPSHHRTPAVGQSVKYASTIWPSR